MKFDFRQSGAWIGMAGLVVTLFLYGYSALTIRGGWTVVVLPLVWVVLFVLGCRWFMKHPYRMLALPVISAAVWFTVILTQTNA